mgnify:CR=1 FL=1
MSPTAYVTVHSVHSNTLRDAQTSNISRRLFCHNNRTVTIIPQSLLHIYCITNLLIGTCLNFIQSVSCNIKEG